MLYSRRHWFAKRKNMGAAIREVMFNEQSALVDNDADNKALDADEALQELGNDLVSFGYVTTTITVSDPSLNDRQIDLIASATPKRHYYYQSP